MIANYLEHSPRQQAKILKLSHDIKETEDDALIRRCLGDDRLAQSALYKKWYNRVFSICLRYANDRDQAKNMVNESFFKVFKNLEKRQTSKSFAGWLKRITINTCIDHVRAQTRLKFTDGDDLPEQGIESDVVSRLAAEDIIANLQKVTPASRIVFSLYIIEGYKHQEIADQLNINVSTSRWHLMNAKKEMKELLKNY